MLDLDDLLVRCANDLERDSSYAEAIRWRFRHIHVDEAQDLTPIQQRLLSALRTPGADDLFIVGDPAQSIYGFNGSDPELLVQIDDRFPGVEVIRLPVNHRCTPQIVNAGVHVLSHAELLADLRSSQPDGPVPTLTAYADEGDEAQGIARSIAEAGQHAIRHGEIAVLARTHQHCTRIELTLTAVGVEVRSRGFRGDSSGRRALDEARRISSPSALRSWAHDILDDDAGALGGDESGPAETVSSRQVAAVALEYLREQPDGTGGPSPPG